MDTRRGAVSLWRGKPSASVVLLCTLFVPASIQAQDSTEPTSLSASAATDNTDTSHHVNRLYFGMWTAHLREHPLALENNWAIGVSHDGYFGATFLNTFGRRAFTGWIERTVVSSGRRPLDASLGYRLGFVTGYDGRFLRIADKTPVLPLVQAFACVDIGHVGIEISYTFVVVSVVTSYRF
jgi:hypothetical protein